MIKLRPFRFVFVILPFLLLLHPKHISGQEVDLMLAKIKVLIEKELTDSALSIIDQCLEQSNSDKCLIQKAKINFLKQNYQQAKIDYLQLSENKHNSANLFLARIYSVENLKSESFLYLNKYLSGEKKVPRSEIMLDPYFLQYEQTNEWKNLWKQNYYSPFELTLEEIDYLLKYEKYFEAIRKTDEALNTIGEFASLYTRKATAYEKLGSDKKALKAYDSAIELYDRNDNYYFSRALLLKKNAKYNQAIEGLNIAIKLAPYNAEYLIERAILYIQTENYNNAANDLNKVLEIDSEHEQALLQLSKCYLANKNYLSALSQINLLIKFHPNNRSYYVLRGDIYFETKAYRMAEKNYNIALDLEASHDIMVKKGNAKCFAGDKKGACKVWKQAQQLGSLKVEALLYEYCE